MFASDHRLSVDESDLAALIKSVARGDEDSFAKLYDRTSPLTYGLAVRMLGNTPAAEEVLCEAYDRIRGQAIEYDDSACAPLTWLVIITRSLALSRLRSGGHNERRDVSLEIMDSENKTKSNSKHCPAVAKRQRSTLMILKILTPDERQALELAYCSGLRVTEIAKHLNQPIGAVKFVIRSGMIKLRVQLESIRPEKKVSTATLLQKG